MRKLIPEFQNEKWISFRQNKKNSTFTKRTPYNEIEKEEFFNRNISPFSLALAANSVLDIKDYHLKQTHESSVLVSDRENSETINQSENTKCYVPFLNQRYTAYELKLPPAGIYKVLNF